MTERIRAKGAVSAVLIASAFAVLPSAAAAQRADFLFSRPAVTLAIRAGWAVPRAQSEIFDFTMDQLVIRPGKDIQRRDFAGPSIQGELAVRVHDRLDVALGVGHTESEIRSEDREFVEDNDLPIEQTTHFRRTPVEVGVKAYLMDRGRAISRFAWVPNRLAPWIGAGAGAMFYDFDQTGDFVDYETLDIFTKSFESQGTTPTAHVAAGLDLSLGPHLLAIGEGRYQWARSDMSTDFKDFDPIDLSGFQITIGVAARF
jgi:hypothetical protein